VKPRTLGMRAAGIGAVGQVVGLGVDGWLHANDPHLAEREGVFSLTNVGHVLFFASLVLVVGGVLLAFVGPRLYRSIGDPAPLRLRLAQVGAPVAALALIGGGMAGASTSSLAAGHHHDDSVAAGHAHHGGRAAAASVGHSHVENVAVDPSVHADHTAAAVADPSGDHSGHDHGTGGAGTDGSSGNGGSDGTGHDHGAPAAPGEPPHDHGAPPPGGGGGGGHDHGSPPPTTPIGPDTQAQLDAVRAFALHYPTAADAVAGGYHQVTNYIPGIAAHYLRLDLLDGTFDVTQPEFLLYGGDGPDAHLVGVAYFFLGNAPPAGFIGDTDVWHQHIDLCIDPNTLMVIGGDNTTPAQCAALGGFILPGNNLWLLHAWVVPGWDSPAGVFSHENPRLT